MLKKISAVLLRTGIYAYIILTAALLPLYVSDYRTLGSDKAFFWMKSFGISGIIIFAGILTSAIYLIISGQGFAALKSRISAFHIWGIIFAISVALSYLLSDYKETALKGETGWYCGTVQYLMIIAVMSIISVSFHGEKIYLYLTLASSFAVFVIGIINEAFGNVFALDGWIEGKVSTIGNANWFCGYMVTVMFLAFSTYVFGDGTVLRRILLSVYIAVSAYICIYQHSSSGFVALYAVFVSLLYICGKNTDHLKSFAQIWIIFFSALLVHSVIPSHKQAGTGDALIRLLNKPIFCIFMIAVFVTVILIIGKLKKCGKTETGLFYGRGILVLTIAGLTLYAVLLTINAMSGGTLFGKGSIMYPGMEWMSSRGATCSCAIRLIRGMTPREIIFGSGPDTFYSLLSSGRYPDLFKETNIYFSGARLTNAHCEPLTMLVNTGIFGTVSFYGMIFSVFTKAVKCYGKDGKRNAVSYGVSLCILAYVINNLFSFQTAMNLSQLSLLLGVGGLIVIKNKKGNCDERT